MPIKIFTRTSLFFFALFLHLNLTLAQCVATITPSGPTTFCQGASVTLTANAGNGIRWFREGTAGPISTGNPITVNASGKYILKMVPSGVGCTDTLSTSVQVNVNPLPNMPDILVTPSTTECPGSTLNFRANNPQDGITYTWNFGDGGTASGKDVNHAFPATGTTTNYTVSLTAKTSSNCSLTTIRNVQVKSSPRIIIVDEDWNFKRCLSSNSSDLTWTFNFQNNSVSSDPVTYKWSWGDNTPDVTVSGTAAQSHTYTRYGVFNLVVTATNQVTNCVSTLTQKVVFEKYPSASLQIPAAQVSICEGETITVTNNSLNATSYKWVWGDGDSTITTSRDPQSHTYNLTRAQACSATGPGVRMIITLYAINDCQEHTNTSPIYVLPKPKPLFTVSRDKVCKTSDASTSTVTFTNSSCPTTGYDDRPNFKWDFGDPSSGASNTSTSRTTVSHYFANPGIYTVTLTAGNSCDTLTYTQLIQVDSPPTSSFALSENSICKGNNLSVTNTSSGFGISYNWSVSTSNFNFTSGTSSSSKEPVFKFTQPGNYTITLTVTNTCNTVTASQNIIVKDAPLISLPASIIFCGAQTLKYGTTAGNQTVNFAANNGSSNTFNWSITGTAGASFTSGSTASNQYPEINFPNPGVYTITVVATNECGASSASSQNITILAPPASPIAPDVNICINQPAVLTASGSTGTYNWFNSASGSTPVGIGTTYTTPSLSSNNTYYVEVTNAENCKSARVPVLVSVTPLITNNSITASQSICINTSPNTLAGSLPSGGGAISYLWESSINNGTSYAPAPGTNSNKDYTSGPLGHTTLFRRRVISPTCPTSLSDPITITIEQNITGNTISADQTICSGATPNTLNPTTTLTGGGNGFTYQWQRSIDNTSFTDISGATAASYTPSTLTQTTWFKRIVRSGACQQTESNAITITVNPIPSVTAANPAPICAGETATLTATVSSGTARWYSAATGGSPVFTGTSFTTPALANSTNTNVTVDYYVEAFALNCISPTRTKVTVTVKPTPVATATPASATICTGSSISIALTSIVSGTSFSWTQVPTGGITGSSNGSGNSISQVLTNASTAPATVTYTITPTAAGCVGTAITVTVTVNPNIQGNTIAGEQSICSGQTSLALTGSTPTGGNGSYTYSWESSTNGSTFTTITGATGQNYSPGSLTTSTWFRRKVTSATCTDFSSSVKVTVYPGITSNVISAAQTICAGSAPAALANAASGPAGGDGSYTYQWQSSTDNVTFTDIASATAATYSPGTLNQSTWYRRLVTSDKCTNTSTSIKITVDQPIVGNTISDGQTICSGSAPLALTGNTPTGGGANGFTYQWQRSLDNTTFTDISNATAASYTPGILTQTTYFRRIARSGVCIQSESNTGIVSVNPIPSVTTANPAPICAGETATLTATVSSGTARWYSAATGGSVLFTGLTYTTPALANSTNTNARVDYYVEAFALNCISPTRTRVTVTIKPTPVATATPASVTICTGNAVSIALTSTVSGTTFTWTQIPNGGVTGSSNGSGNTINQTLINAGSAPATVSYTITPTAAGCIGSAVTVTVTVNPTIQSNTIAGEQSICSGQSTIAITGTTPTGGSGTYTFAWERSTISSSTGFTTISGANNLDYSPGNLVTSTWYRRRVTSGNCEDISPVVKVTVYPGITNNIISAAQTICAGSTPVTLTNAASGPAGGDGSYTYQWQSSIDNVTFTDIASATTATYSPGTLSQSTWYRRLVTSDKCTNTSTSIKITVDQPIAGNTIAGNQIICSGSAPLALTGTAPTGGGAGGFTYQWQRSLDNTSFTDISGATAASYTSSILTQTTYFRRIVRSGACQQDESNIITITVNPIPTVSTANPAPICAGETATLSATVSSGTARWYSTATGGSVLFTGLTYTTPALANSTNTNATVDYYVEAFALNCISPTRTKATVTVKPTPVATATPASLTICTGYDVSIALTSTVSGTSFSWTQVPTGGITGSGNGSGNSISQVLTNTSTAPATITYTIIPTAAGCVGAAITVTITVNPNIQGNTIAGEQSICSGQAPLALTGALPTGGSGSFTYAWESSTNGSTFTTITGATGQNYSPGSLTTSTWFRRKVTSATCTDVSSIVKVTVYPGITNNIISTSQTICSGTAPATLTNASSGPAGGDNSYTYLWESSTDGINFTAAAGTNTNFNYSPGTLNQSTWYRRLVSSDKCTNTSASIKITVDQPIAGNTISADQTICSGSAPLALTGITPTGGGANGFTYQWQRRIDNTTFTDISNATSATYTPGILTQTTYFRRIARSGVCIQSESNSITIIVNPIPTVTAANPAPICAGETATLTATVSSGTARWYSAATGGSLLFTGLSYTTPVLANNSTSNTTIDYFVEAFALNCVSPTRTKVTVTVKPTPVASATPASVTICTGSSISIALTSTVSGTTFSWTQSSSTATITGAANGSGTTIAQTLVNTGTTPANVTYTIFPTAAGCNGSAVTVTVTVNPTIQSNTIAEEQSICSGQTPLVLTGSAPTGGSGAYSFSWESSTNGTSFNPIANSNSQNFTPGPLTTSTWYRRKIISVNCEDISPAVKVTVYPGITNNNISAAQTICAGSLPTTLTNAASGPAGGDGSYIYQWQSSTDNVNFTDIASATTATYSPGTLNQSTWYRRLVTSDKCTNTSASIKITVDQPIAGNTIVGDQTICSGFSANLFNGTTTLSGGGAGGFTYQWQRSLDNATFTDISNATSTSYTPGILTQTTYFRRIARSGECIQSESNSITITVNPIPTVTAANPAPICAGETATLTATVSSGTARWYTTANGGSPVFTGTSFTTPTLANSTNINATVDYYVEAFALNCVSPTRTKVTVTVKPTPVATATPASLTICTGNAVSIALTSTVSGTSFSWTQSSSTVAVTGAANGSGTAIAQTLVNTGITPATVTYTIIPTAAGCIGAAITVTVTVNPAIQGNIIAGEQSICSGQTPLALTGALPTGGSGSYTYAWESSTNGTSFTAITGATGQNYSPGSLTTSTWFRRLVVSASCDNPSAAVKVNVTPPIANNTIAQAETICTGTSPQTIRGSLPSGGNNVYSYTWYESLDNVNFTVIVGKTGQDLDPGILTQSTYFRRSVTSESCTQNSNAILITVYEKIANNNIAGDQIICEGAAPLKLTGSLPTGGNGIYLYSWEKSEDNATYEVVLNANAQDFSPGNLTKTTWYRRTVAAGPCDPITSLVVKITVNPSLRNNTLSGNQTICTGTAPVTITGSTPTGGDGNYTYRWESNTTSAAGGFGLAAGEADKINYSPATLTRTTWFRRVVTSGGCTFTSNPTEVTVNELIANNSILTPAATICSGTSGPLLTGSVPTGGNSNYTYEWQYSTKSESNGFISAPGANAARDYAPGSLTTTTWFRRVVVAGPCEISTSGTVKITVNEPITQNTVSATQEICIGNTPASLTGSSPQGGNGQYEFVWEYSTTSATTGFNPAPGRNNEQNFTPGPLFTSTWVRRKVISLPCPPDYSPAIWIEVTPLITNNTLPANQEVCEGVAATTIIGTTPTGGNGTFTYLWQTSTDSIHYVTAGGINSQKDYAPPALFSHTWYRRIVMSGSCSNVSEQARITVNKVLSNNQVSTDQAVCVGGIPDLLVGSSPAGGNGKYIYLWEHSTNGKDFTAGVGTNNEIDYNPGSLLQTTWFRRTVTAGPCDPLISNVVKITINPLITHNSISKAQRICQGTLAAPLSGTIPTGGDGIYTYVWEISTAGPNTGYQVATGASARTASYDPGYVMQTSWIRRTVFSGGCTHTSRPIQIVVDTEITNNTVTTNQTICYGNAPSKFIGANPGGGNGIYLYTWEISTDGTNFNPAPGLNSEKDYQAPNLIVTTWFRRAIQSLPCQASESNIIKVTVLSLISSNTISANQHICFDAVPATLTGSNPAGGGGNYLYLWQSSTTGPDTGFTPAAGKNNEMNYSPTALKQTTWFRRVVSSDPCNSITSTAVEIKVKPLTPTPSVRDVSICPGFTATLPAEGLADGYEWYDAPKGGRLLFTGTTFTTPVLSTTTTYYVQSVVDGCAGGRFEAKAIVYDFKPDAGPDVLISRGETVRLKASGGIKYSWTPGETLNDSTAATPFATPKETTIYTVRVTSAEGCVGTDEVKVTIIPNIIVSNGITPNGDGYNDTWVIQNIEYYPDASIEIFNRWGNRIYHSKGYVQAWDGKYNGQDLPVAAYYYVIKLDQKKTPVSGSITIAR